jgi:hypothetical protein
VRKQVLKSSLVLKIISRFAFKFFKPQNQKIMKKLFAVLALAGVLAACNNKKKDEKKPTGDSVTTTTTTTPTENTTTTTTTTTTEAGAPSFSDPDVQKYASDYAAFVDSYVAAYKGKDYSKIAELGKNMQDWTQKSAAISQKLIAHPDEAQKFSAYLIKLSQEMTSAMQMK